MKLGPVVPDLLRNDREPFRLSRNHFAIVRHDRGLFVRDLHSTLGIGWHFGADETSLRAGDNEIVHPSSSRSK